MAKTRGGAPKQQARAPQPQRDPGAAVAVAALAVVLLGTALIVDTAAGAAFDAPKRLIALAGTAVAVAAAFAMAPRALAPLALRQVPGLNRAALALGLAALAGALLSALLSPRRAVSLDAMRSVALLALLVPLGASRVMERGGRWLASTYLGACAVNAGVSILQSRNLFHPFALETSGGRQDTGAYAGNVGYLATALALAGVLALGLLVSTRRPIERALAGVALALFAAALVVNQNVTALTSLLAGAGVVLVLVLRRRAVLPLAAVAVAVVVAFATYAPLRYRAQEIASAARQGNWDAIVSFRGGPWAAALEMTRERPLTGFGPGTFGAEYVPHRLAAEIRAHRRFVAPLLTSSYGEAHCDYLQAFSDAGVAVGLLALGAAACLLAALARRAWRGGSAEAIVLLGVLVAGAAAALTWFPFQRPITAVPLLLAAGRAWRISSRAEEAEVSA